jgi:hypothetical protein
MWEQENRDEQPGAEERVYFDIPVVSAHADARHPKRMPLRRDRGSCGATIALSVRRGGL